MTAPQRTADPSLDRIERSVRIDATVDKVWAALTRADLLARWFGQRVTLEARVGGRLTLHWDTPRDVRPEDRDCYGTFLADVTELEEGRVFAFRWALRADLEPDAGNSTLVRFTLRPDGSGTLLTVVESGFSELTAVDPTETVRKNTEGWAFELGELVEYLTGAAT
ncbi:SRPBCC domain-containing protein [Nakamurella endophytica]|uniref:Vanillate O-demethylase oxidoreductase VanB n=1 Tax=Nakamurella endophytica TaxID=1748367 RepID=A0A917TAX1_9ACTN|nr:SRPBCC domain-containing protein [Nakamurella endophytica]GGM13937.1 vanillate O-demethylase oxidoreductase VanB [Nakamurella endophytica]